MPASIASPTIEFLWFDGCPHHETARRLLDEVLASRAIAAEVRTIEVADQQAAERVRFPGSPTIRIDGRDVDETYRDPGEYAPGCRLYATSDGLSGVPERAWIEAALDRALHGSVAP